MEFLKTVMSQLGDLKGDFVQEITADDEQARSPDAASGEDGDQIGSGVDEEGGPVVKKLNELVEQKQKEYVIEQIDRFISERIVAAGNLISAMAGDKIRDGDIILTYGRSSVVEQLLLRAHGSTSDESGGTAATGAEKSKKQFHVVIVDSRPYLEGQGLLERLTAAGITCTYVLLNAISYAMVNVTKVFLGAAAIGSNGAVLSRVGTAAVAMMAKSRNIPVIFCCETYKLTEKVFLDSIVNNELGSPAALWPPHERESSSSGDSADGGGGDGSGRRSGKVKYLNLTYDVTPIKFVGMVVTEVGMIPPTAIPAVLREYHRERNPGEGGRR